MAGHLAPVHTALLVCTEPGSYKADASEIGVTSVRKPAVIVIVAGLALSACGLNQNPFVVKRSPCPAVAVLAHAGDVTLFSPADSRDADAIDVVATITNLRAACNDTGGHIMSTASYDVIARRTDPAGTREVTFPTFAAVIQAGTKLVAKQTGQVTVRFVDGQTRATGSGSATGKIDREAASLSAEISQKIERKRKPGDLDAAIDPLAAPDVRAAVKNASFELLVGFQLDDTSLEYNVTK